MLSPFTLFFFLLLLFPISFSELCNPNDKKALLKIKKSLNDPYTLISWDPKQDCCDWVAVECDDKTHRVTSLDISVDDEVSGQIPPEVGDLPFLEYLQFHKLPKLVGPIQPAIAKLHNLKFLDISWTNVSGSIPDFLSTLSKLTYIRLSFNKLTGPIPPSLSKIPNLGSIQLGRNKLTGPIPDSFGSFNDPSFELHVSHNQLSGRIPPSLSRVNFFAIDLSRNKLEGDGSVLFGAGKIAWKVDLSRNSLEFNLSNVVFSKNLYWLDINHNKIYGGLPKKLTELKLNGYFNVSYNQLCGPIPQGGRLQKFDVYSYSHNKCLCGAPLESCK